MKTENIYGGNPVDDAIKAGYSFNKASKQHNEMIKGIDRLMRVNRRLTNPIEANRADILPWYLYDTLETAHTTATPTLYDFFTVPMSATKPKEDTNMELVSQLPAPQHFNCTSLQVFPASDMLKGDIDSIFENYWLEFWIGNKNYAEGPVYKFPAGGGLSGVSVVSGQASWTNGIPSPIAVVDFRMGDNPIGHHILQGQTFHVKLMGTSFTTATSASGGTGVRLTMVLEGILSRGVQ